MCSSDLLANLRQRARRRAKQHHPYSVKVAPMQKFTSVTQDKRDGKLHNKIFNRNIVVSGNAWDVFPLMNVAQGTNEDDRIGNKAHLRE